MPKFVFMVAFAGALFGGPFLYGFNTAVINTPADVIKVFCIEVHMTRQGENFTEFFNYVKTAGSFPLHKQSPNDTTMTSPAGIGSDTFSSNVSELVRQAFETDLQTQAFISQNMRQLPQGSSLTTFWSIAVAVYVVGGTVGAFASGTFADRVGRRNGMLVNQIFAIFGIAFETLAKYTHLPELLVVGRLLVGFSCSMGVTLGAMYLTEITPKEQRGRAGTCVQLGIMSGVLVGQIVGLNAIFGNSALWPLCFAFALVPITFSLATLPFLPESARFLSIDKQRDEAARRAIARFRGDHAAEIELTELLTERDGSDKGDQHVSICKLFTSKQYSLPIFLAVWLYVVQQWSGINAILSYSETMFKSVGIASEYIQYAVLSTGIVSILSVLVAIGLSEKMGRRRLMIYPTFVMSFLMVAFSIMVLLKENSSAIKYVSLVVFLLYVAGFNLGCGTVPAYFVNEVFRQNSRGAATTTAQISHWINSALVVYTFPYVEIALKEYTYLLYAGILIVSGVIFVVYMPETSGLSVNLLARMLSFGLKVPVLTLQNKFKADIDADRRGHKNLNGRKAYEDIMLVSSQPSDKV